MLAHYLLLNNKNLLTINLNYMKKFYNVLLTYDVDNKHTEIRKKLIDEYDFEEIIIGDDRTRCNLPNTTLLKRNTTKENVFRIIKDVCKMLNVKLERVISTECSNWIALKGERL